MHSVREALELVAGHAGAQPIERTDLVDCLGLTLAEPIAADLDSPPFTKSLMDGYAVRNADIAGGRATLEVLGTLAAGAVSEREVGPGQALQIMTGAPLPRGAEAVIMVERSRSAGLNRVDLEDPTFQPGQNVMPRGMEMRASETVLEPGHRLGPPEIGLLATVGQVRPLVYRRPTLAILSTGDELVPPDQLPGPGQIRNSNESTLVALAHQAGAAVTTLGIARDNEDELAAKVALGVEHDLLILSGGVSAGQRDLVPGVLARHGVETVFHKVEFKPGKPVWFGRHPGGLVFGLPGNPVSVLVCFELFVRTALRARQGDTAPMPRELSAQLIATHHYPTRRLTYHPARLTWNQRHYEVEPVTWHGSPDLRALIAANALVVFPVTDQPHPAGTLLSVLPLARD